MQGQEGRGKKRGKSARRNAPERRSYASSRRASSAQDRLRRRCGATAQKHAATPCEAKWSGNHLGHQFIREIYASSGHREWAYEARISNTPEGHGRVGNLTCRRRDPTLALGDANNRSVV